MTMAKTKLRVLMLRDIVVDGERCNFDCNFCDGWNCECTGFRTKAGDPKRLHWNERAQSYRRLPECIEAEKRGVK